MKHFAFLFLAFYLATTFGYSQVDSTDYQKGITRIMDGKYEEAATFFTKAIESNPHDPYAYFNRGYTKSMLELNEEAIIDFSKAIEIEPAYKNAYLNRGIAKRKLTDFEGAQMDYKLAIIKAPDYAEAYYHRGFVFELLENKDSACYFYKIAADFGLKQMDSKIRTCEDNKKLFDKHIIRLNKLAASKEYGFSESNPIKVGGSPTNQREYLNLLRDATGKPIQYKRTGSCCGYKLPSSPLGMAMLDRYRIVYNDENGKEKTADVFITFYEYEEPSILFGFKTITIP